MPRFVTRCGLDWHAALRGRAAKMDQENRLCVFDPWRIRRDRLPEQDWSGRQPLRSIRSFGAVGGDERNCDQVDQDPG